MTRYTTQPRRLRVSALAAVANPSYARVDTWNLLDDACRHLAEVDLAGLDKTHDVARVKRLMDRIGAYERYWLYPGAENLATFRAHLESLSTVRLTEEVSHGRAAAERIRRPRRAFRHLRAAGRPGAGGPGQTAAVLHRVARRRRARDGPRLPGRMPAGAAQPVRRRAVRDPGGAQRRRRHHRGRAERRDPGRDHPRRPAAAVPGPAAADEHAARAQRGRGRSHSRPRQRLGGMRRMDPGAAAPHRPVPAHRRVDRGGRRQRARRL